MPRIEQTALSNLIHNEEYTRKVLPFIKQEYFADRLEGLLFLEIYKFVDKYNRKANFKRGIASLRNRGIKATWKRVYSHYYSKFISYTNT